MTELIFWLSSYLTSCVVCSCQGVLLLVLKHLRSLQTDLQHLCVTILFHTAINTEDTSRSA